MKGAPLVGQTEHVLHICSSCVGLGGGVGIERGEMKWGGDILLTCTWFMPFVMNSKMLNDQCFNYCC